jgi:hypothetical protein
MTSPSHLPPRAGPRPTTTSELPHSQLDQQPSDGRYLRSILAEAATWPFVSFEPSRISVEGACALTLDGQVAGGPPEAFMIDREFCHGHAGGDYSLHANLPLALAAQAEAAGWAEPHYLVRRGRAPANVVLLFAARDELERDVVVSLVRASYQFAIGAQPDPEPPICAEETEQPCP